MISPKDVLPELLASGLDRHEAVEALTSVLSASGSHMSAKRTYDLANGTDVVAQAVYDRNGRFSKLYVPRSLWPQARDAITSDAASQEFRVARTTMLSYRELLAAYTIPGWLQIRPVAASLQDRTGHAVLSRPYAAGVPHPFALEVVYRWSGLIFLESRRSLTAVEMARWLLATFIDIPVFSLTAPYAWAFIDYSYALVACGISDGLEEASPSNFSDVSHLPQMTPVPTEQYYTSLGIGSPGFRVPDIGQFYSNFLAMDESDRVKFLRCCAAIYSATNPTIRWPLRLVSLVNAIEPLLEQGEQCDKCKSHIGITKQFKSFLDEYVHPTPEVRSIYEAIYRNRSMIVHGGWNPDVDEPFFSLHSIDETRGLTAWSAAKRGAVNWLIARGRVKGPGARLKYWRAQRRVAHSNR